MPRRLLAFSLVFVACLDPDGDTTTTSSSSSSTGPASSEGSSSSSSDTGSGGSSTGKGSGSATMTGTAATSSSTTGELTSGEQTTGGTTTGDPPVCGDGLVNAADEECDDGNTDAEDGCDNFCHRDRIVFATSEKFSPDWIGGLKPADDICKQLANKAGLDNPFSFTAWLSDSTADAIARIHPGQGRYLRPDGILVAHGAAQFASGALQAPIQTDEYGEPLDPAAVWTGTRPDGTRVPLAGNCSDWTTNSLLEKGPIGDISAIGSDWTFIPDPDINPSPCPGDNHLYCIEGK